MKIYLKADIIGTCYIELMKGKFRNKHWNENSIYFSEEDFTLYELIFAKFNDAYRPFRDTSFGKQSARLILQELNKFLNKVKANKNAIDSLREMDYDIYTLSNSAIDEIKSVTTIELESTTNILTEWIENTMQNNDHFSVIGL